MADSPFCGPFGPVAAVLVDEFDRTAAVKRSSPKLLQEKGHAGVMAPSLNVERPFHVKWLRERVAASTHDHPVDTYQREIDRPEQGLKR